MIIIILQRFLVCKSFHRYFHLNLQLALYSTDKSIIIIIITIIIIDSRFTTEKTVT